MNTATLSKKYQLEFPKEIREAHGLKAGDSFEIISYNNRIELIPLRPIRELKGIFHGINTSIIREDDRI
jgi:AbrB family looped-hinge helix DNA binding protein